MISKYPLAVICQFPLDVPLICQFLLHVVPIRPNCTLKLLYLAYKPLFLLLKVPFPIPTDDNILLANHEIRPLSLARLLILCESLILQTIVIFCNAINVLEVVFAQSTKIF